MKIHVNTETLTSHTPLTEEKHIPVAPSSMACRHLKHAYLEVALSCSIAPLPLQYIHDGERVTAALVFSQNRNKVRDRNLLIDRHRDICPENVDSRISFGVFLESNGEIRIFLGPLSFANSSCVTN